MTMAVSPFSSKFLNKFTIPVLLWFASEAIYVELLNGFMVFHGGCRFIPSYITYTQQKFVLAKN